MSESKPHVLPCPFCGSNDVFAVETHEEVADYWSVLCDYCTAEGPLRILEKEAIKAWNTRK